MTPALAFANGLAAAAGEGAAFAGLGLPLARVLGDGGEPDLAEPRRHRAALLAGFQFTRSFPTNLIVPPLILPPEVSR